MNPKGSDMSNVVNLDVYLNKRANNKLKILWIS